MGRKTRSTAREEDYRLAPTGLSQPIAWACTPSQGFGLPLARPVPGSARLRSKRLEKRFPPPCRSLALLLGAP